MLEAKNCEEEKCTFCLPLLPSPPLSRADSL